MQSKRNQSAKKNTIVFKIFAGVLLAMAVTVVGAIVTASMMNREIIGEKHVSITSYIILLISSFAGALISGRTEKSQILLSILITAAVYILLLFGLKVILFDTPFGGIGKGISAILLGLLPYIVIAYKPKGGKKVKFKYSPK